MPTSSSTAAVRSTLPAARGVGTGTLRDLWVSTNNGATFTQPSANPPAFMTAGRGRYKAFLLHRYSLALGKDILYFGTGWNNQDNHNGQPQWRAPVAAAALPSPALIASVPVVCPACPSVCADIWASSDEGVSWTMITLHAPFRLRDAAGAEITAAGLIVIAGGQATLPTSEVLNDGPHPTSHLSATTSASPLRLCSVLTLLPCCVRLWSAVWVSADGGYTWGQCVEDANWGDRREPATVFDATESLYVLGGRTGTSGDRLYNDVFRSDFPFSLLRQVQSACSIEIPACGPGLTCWPGAPGTTFTRAGGVTCPTLERCKRGILPSSTGGGGGGGVVPPRLPSSTSAARPKPPPYDPCDDWPIEDPYCPGYVGASTGGGAGASAGMNGWLIGLIVVIGAVLLLGVGWYLWRQRRMKGAQGFEGGHPLMSDMTAPMTTSPSV